MNALSRDVGKATAGVQEAPSPARAAGMRVTSTMPTSRMTHLFAFLFERFALLIHMAFSRGAGAGYDCGPFQGQSWRQGKRGSYHTRPGCLRLTLKGPVAGGVRGLHPGFVSSCFQTLTKNTVQTAGF